MKAEENPREENGISNRQNYPTFISPLTAAAEHTVPLERISFKGTLDAVRQFTQAMSQARSKKKRGQLWDKLIRTLAADLVPERPGRREPRAVKRVKQKYPSLTRPRHQFTDRPKSSIRRAIRLAKRRLEKLGLK